MDDALHAHVVGSVLRQSGEDQIARQLADQPLGVLDLLECEIRPGAGLQLGLAVGGLEAQRLRPDAILAGRKRREAPTSSVNTVVVTVAPTALADTVTPPSSRRPAP
jgi:hypothetical protein